MDNTYENIKLLVERALALESEAIIARQNGDTKHGGKVYEELLNLIPKAERLIDFNTNHNAFAHFCLGIILRVLHIYSDAISEFMLSLEIAPNVESTLLEITMCLAQAGDLNEADTYARRTIEKFPNSAAAWGNFSMILIQLKKKSDAFDAISNAVNLDPRNEKNRYILDNFHRYFD